MTTSQNNSTQYFYNPYCKHLSCDISKNELAHEYETVSLSEAKELLKQVDAETGLYAVFNSTDLSR